MSKLICDVCGTSYPETASQCPICGCAKPVSANPVAEDGDAGGYTYVKGGRFSKSNVRKRSRAIAAGKEMARVQPRKEQPRKERVRKEQPPVEQMWEEEDWDERDDKSLEQGPANGQDRSNKGLIIILAILLLAIAAVLVYIIDLLNKPDEQANRPSISQTTPQDTSEPDSSSETPGPQLIPCTDLDVSADPIELTVGETFQLQAVATPEDTTDQLTFTSADAAVATVSDTGLVTAVTAGEVTVTVTCGQVSKTCKIVCKEKGPEVPPNADDWRLNREDFSLDKPGDTWKLLRGSTDPSLITFTSDNEKVVTFENGVVKAIGKGRTKVHASYNGREFSCWVSVLSW